MHNFDLYYPLSKTECILYYYYIHLTALFLDNLGKPAPEGKPFWILLEHKMMGWQWHQLDHMQIICTSPHTDKHASTPPLSFLQAICPSCRPTNSVKALSAYYTRELIKLANFPMVTNDKWLSCCCFMADGAEMKLKLPQRPT